VTTSAPTSLPMWLAGCTYDGNSGNDLRNTDITAEWLDTGILTGTNVGVWAGVTSGAALKVAAASGMTVTVGPGSFVVPNTASAIAGGYQATLASSVTLSVAAADTVNPRIDLVCANVVDNGNSSSFGEVQIITGTPASSPAAPAAPANSVPLALITVPANATSIVSGNIADARTFTAAAGGIPIAPKSGSLALPAGYNGLLAFDPVSGTFYHMGAAGAGQAPVLPFAPIHTLIAGGTAIGSVSSPATVATVGITTDGHTDLQITVRIAEIEQVSGSSSAGTLIVETLLDGTVIDQYYPQISSGGAPSTTGNGFFVRAYTSAAATTTPSAGTHTLTVKIGINPTSGTYQVKSFTPSQSWVRIEPVGL
jgi:hypothetical protein